MNLLQCAASEYVRRNAIRKRFFLEMFTRDISLEDCILDLVDNSIDGLIRRDKIDLTTIFSSLRAAPGMSLPSIKINYDATQFTIVDECGGIPRADACEDVFNFGHEKGHDSLHAGRRLGAYGIGLKRALFKIGNQFEITSRTVKEGFEVNVDVEKWSKKDNKPKDWTFPIKFTSGARDKESAGTTISISQIPKEIQHALKSPVLESALYQKAAQTYALFLNRFVTLQIGVKKVEPLEIPIGESEYISPSVEVFEDDGVHTTIYANFAARSSISPWRSETAGWYVLCNGRLVVVADKSELTGWGAEMLPSFQPKFRGFVGLVSFASNDPLKLPWTTTKRGLNRDALIYQKTRAKMAQAAKPIIRLLEKFYSPEKDEYAAEKKAARSASQVNVETVAGTNQTSQFRMKIKSDKQAVKRSVEPRICFRAKLTDLKRAKRHLKGQSLSNREFGEFIFEYFMKSEGLR